MGAIPKIWNQVQTPEVTRNALAELLLQRGPEAQKTLRDFFVRNERNIVGDKKRDHFF
jgi:hypothetical protein